jgi:hypothetical protein
MTFFDLDTMLAPDRELTTMEKFSLFHVQNPQVFKALEEMTEQMVKRGRSKLSVKMMIEVLRWSYYLTTNDPNSEFKINNSYSSLYVRLLIDTHREWENLFQLREVHDTKGFIVRKKTNA